jgi:hypothetical protein
MALDVTDGPVAVFLIIIGRWWRRRRRHVDRLGVTRTGESRPDQEAGGDSTNDTGGDATAVAMGLRGRWQRNRQKCDGAECEKGLFHAGFHAICFWPMKLAHLALAGLKRRLRTA